MINRALPLAAAVLICVLCLAPDRASAQARPFHFISTASTNATSVAGPEARVLVVSAINTTTTIYYLKFYDKVSTPSCNTDPVKFTIPIPFGSSNAGGGVVLPIPEGLFFDNGFGFCITGGSADNDNTNAATGIIVSFGIR